MLYFYCASDFDGAEEKWMWRSQEAMSSLTNGNFLLPTGGAVVRNPNGSSPKLYNHYYWSIVSKSILTLGSKAGGHARSGGRAPGGIWKSWRTDTTNRGKEPRHHQGPKCHNIWRGAFTPTIASSFSCHTAALRRKEEKKQQNSTVIEW